MGTRNLKRAAAQVVGRILEDEDEVPIRASIFRMLAPANWKDLLRELHAKGYTITTPWSNSATEEDDDCEAWEGWTVPNRLDRIAIKEIPVDFHGGCLISVEPASPRELTVHLRDIQGNFFDPQWDVKLPAPIINFLDRLEAHLRGKDYLDVNRADAQVPFLES